MSSLMVPKASVYCPPRKRFRGAKTTATDQAIEGTGRKPGSGQRVLTRSKPFMPDPKRKRVHHYIRGLLLAPIYWPFTFLAMLFPRHLGHHHHNEGFRRIYTYLVPVCFCPELLFYIVNFLHVPVAAFLFLTAWYCLGYREALVSLFRERVTEFRFCSPPPDALFSDGPIVGLDVDAHHLFITACLISILCIIGVIGFYTGSKILILLWLLMIIAIQRELSVAYNNEFISNTNCQGSFSPLIMCFTWNIKGHYFYEGMSEYEPPRVLSNLQYSMECCGVQIYRDYYNFYFKELPSSCALVRWNKNIYAGWLSRRTAHKGYLNVLGCADAWIDRCRTHIGLRTHGVRVVIFYHTILFIVGVILIVVYFSMLRTMAISAYHFDVTLRNNVFPKIMKTREQRRQEEELKIQSNIKARLGVRGLDGRVEPEVLLRQHLEAEFIRNDNDDWNGFSDHYPPDVEALIEKLRRKHDLGNEDLGFGEGDVEEVAEENCMVNLEDLLRAKSRIVATAESLISATRQKYLIAQSKNLDASLTTETVGKELKGEIGALPAKSGVIWKWEENNRLDLLKIMDQVDKHAASDAARRKNLAKKWFKKKQGNTRFALFGKSFDSVPARKKSKSQNKQSKQDKVDRNSSKQK